MARVKGSMKLSSNMEVNAGAPIDARSIVPTEADLIIASNFPYSYIGMLVVAQDTKKLYMLTAKPSTAKANWKLVEGGSDEELTQEQLDALLNLI